MNTIELNLNRLCECRKKLCLTKQETAKRLQVSQPTYLRYESGERAPSIHTIQSIAAVLDTSVEYLTNQTDNIKPNTYIINELSDPELFHLVEIYKQSDIAQQHRIVKYFREFEKIF